MIIHMNSHIIRSNAKHGENNPPVSIRKTKHGPVVDRCHSVLIKGPSAVVYDQNKPLSCGARVWIDTGSSEIETRLMEVPV